MNTKEASEGFMYVSSDIAPGKLASSFHEAERNKTYKRAHPIKTAAKSVRRSTHLGRKTK